MKHWRELLQTLLISSKYIWQPMPKTLDESEFYGANDQMGFLDHVIDFISDVEKQAYKAGFAEGAAEVVKEREPEMVIDVTTNQITAERKYLEWRK